MNIQKLAIHYGIMALVVIFIEKYLVEFLSKYLTFLISIPYVLRFIALFVILLISDLALHKFYPFT